MASPSHMLSFAECRISLNSLESDHIVWEAPSAPEYHDRGVEKHRMFPIMETISNRGQ
jgi:hypothetical protein